MASEIDCKTDRFNLFILGQIFFDMQKPKVITERKSDLSEYGDETELVRVKVIFYGHLLVVI
jgi:hypothetical protein